MSKVTVVDVQNSCWFAMQKLHEGKMDAVAANAVATNAREILRGARVRVAIIASPGLPDDLYEFAKGK